MKARKRKRRPIPRLITAKWLRARGACTDEVELFNKTFPNGTLLTKSSILQALEAGLAIFWFFYRLRDAGRITSQQKCRLSDRVRRICHTKNRACYWIRAMREPASMRKLLLEIEYRKCSFATVQVYAQAFRELGLLEEE